MTNDVKVKNIHTPGASAGTNLNLQCQDKSSWHWCFESSDVWHTDRDDYVSNNYLKPDWLSV